MAPPPSPPPPVFHDAPVFSSYNRIRPLLDTVDRLRKLNVVQEGIKLPTIVVVGDQSAGKSSVLESLAGISLPRGEGTCTRVPLIMCLRNQPNPNPELSLEFRGQTVPTDEASVTDAISRATEKIAGEGYGVSNTPLTLVVKKSNIPDLTMVDLPGFTRVPVDGQPADIYEQISSIVMDFIEQDESIILNVLSASLDLNLCDSIRMSQKVDPTGQRTLAVVTKADKDPDGLFKMVTSNKVSIGLGYFCVRNRVGDETYEEALEKEAQLFKTHHLLSGINRSMVGIPALAQRLVEIQARLIIKFVPEIKRNVNNRLSSEMDELSKLPDTITSVVEASALFGRILGKAQEFLNKILLTEEIDKNEMHSMSRLTKIIYGYSHDMQAKGSQNEAKNMFLLEEIILLEEMKGIELPDFLPRAAFRILLEKKVKGLSFTTLEFIHNMWAYIEDEVISVLTKHFVNYPQLLPSMMWAVQNLVAMERKQSEVWVLDVVEMERKTDYTCSPDYLALWKKLMAHHKVFVEILEDESKTANMAIDGYGNVDVSHLRSWTGTAVVHEAFDLKMRLMSYWKIVLQRFVDCVALHLLFCIRNLVNKDMEVEITKVVLGPEVKGPERMLEELPAVAEKRKKLKHSIALLEESKDALAQIDNDIAGIRMGQAGSRRWSMIKDS